MSLTHFNIYINELGRAPKQSAEPSIILVDTTEVKCLLFVDDLVLLSPTKERLQQSLNRQAPILPDQGLDSESNKDKNDGIPKKTPSPKPQI